MAVQVTKHHIYHGVSLGALDARGNENVDLLDAESESTLDCEICLIFDAVESTSVFFSGM